MANITPYETKAGKRYRVRYRKPDKSQTDKRGFKTKREAQIFAATVTVAKATGDYIDPQLGKVTITQLAGGYLAGKEAALKPSAYRALESAWRIHLKEAWGGREVKGIQPSEVQKWVSELAKKRSATTVKRALGVLHGILEAAIADRRISRNPAAKTQTPKKGVSKSRVYLTHDQLHQLAAHSRYPALVLTLGYTGLRWGEATGLRVRNFNEVRRRLHVEENAVMVGGVLHVGTPKTHRKRNVPYPKFLAKQLEAQTRNKAPDAILFGDGTHYVTLPNSNRGWFDTAIKSIWEEQQEAAAAAEEQGEKYEVPRFPRVTPHDLRHTAASLAISAGANVKAVQRMLGHASAAMTLDTYADLFDDDLDGVAMRLDEAVRNASVGKMWAKIVS